MTPDEAAFWRAIVADPRDRLPRHVYADWLAEHGRYLLEEAVRATIEKHPQPRTFHEWDDALYTHQTHPQLDGWYWVSLRGLMSGRTYNRHFTIAHDVWDAIRAYSSHRWLWYKRLNTAQAAFAALWDAHVTVHHPGELVSCLDPASIFAEGGG